MSADDALAAVSDALGSVSDVAQELPDDLPEGKEGGGQGGGADNRGGRGRPGCLTFLLPVTTPGCATWLTFLFLVTTTLAVFTWFWWDPDNVAWRDAIGWPRLAALGLLIIVIPVIVYRLLVLWLEGAPTPFPDLDYAWAEGLHALAVNGLSPGGIPIYLILGSRSETQERALMDATGMRFRVAGVPQGPAPLHWYANSEAIFLFCSDCSWTSALASLRDELVAEALAKSPGASDSLTNYEYIDSTYINTIDPPATTASWNQPPQPTAPNQPTGPLRPTDPRSAGRDEACVEPSCSTNTKVRAAVSSFPRQREHQRRI